MWFSVRLLFGTCKFMHLSFLLSFCPSVSGALNARKTLSVSGSYLVTLIMTLLSLNILTRPCVSFAPAARGNDYSVRPYTSPFVAHIITPTSAYMCTLTNIFSLLTPTYQHTNTHTCTSSPLKPKHICSCCLWIHSYSFFFLTLLMNLPQLNALVLSVSDQSSFCV